ncbi:MAG: membrane dipeptidase [Anaerolineales bacterium]|nr:membrane dipeptidase [Anaerolineales bacterium]MCZ2120895.1 membrane dipeptidase [Anaerolineales bacterium]
MLIIDSHLDLAWNALQWNRNLQRPINLIREQEKQLQGAGRGMGTISLPEMRKGRVAICFATLLARSTGTPQPDIDYESPAQAYGIAQGQLAYYRGLEELDEIRVLVNQAQLENHFIEWQTWEADTAAKQPPPGIIISMESADPLLSPNQLSAWKAAGVRVIGPAHYGAGRYAGGTSTNLGFTKNGFALLPEMERLNIALDLTHLTDEAFWEALENFNGVVLASHNNCRALVPGQRQFDDRQLRAIIERDGVIGAALDNWMLHPAWQRGAKENPKVVLEDVVNHIDHICQLAGNCLHAAIGSDLDGGFGREQSPADLHTIADLQKLAEILESRGYQQADIKKIMHENWMRVLRRILN